MHLNHLSTSPSLGYRCFCVTKLVADDWDRIIQHNTGRGTPYQQTTTVERLLYLYNMCATYWTMQPMHYKRHLYLYTEHTSPLAVRCCRCTTFASCFVYFRFIRLRQSVSFIITGFVPFPQQQSAIDWSKKPAAHSDGFTNNAVFTFNCRCCVLIV